VSSATLGVAQVTVPLSGTAQIASGLAVTPTQLSFGILSLGQSSAAQTATVTNTSTIAASGFTVGVSGQTGSSQFSVAQSTCSGNLAAGASCTVGVIFAPTATGATTGVLTFASVAMATPATVSLSGSGAAGAAIEVTPGAIIFATTGVGAVSTQTLITVTNTGISASLSNLTLAVSAGFLLVNNACGATLGPGLSCTAAVEFAPASGGAQTGTLTVTSTSATAASVPLSGTGLDFTLTISGSGSQTVSAGQTASYLLAITPLNGSQGTFTFVCGTLPAHAVCIFNPVTETLAGGAVGNVTVEISTGTVGTLVRPALPTEWRLIPLVCGLVLLPFGWKRRRKALMVAALLSIFVGGVASCTSSGGGSKGSSGGSGGSGATPAGTYSIQASAASSGVEHSVLLTLTVD
jgi:Abnormal spindle-like microcephaly-assoc'd, ASPM-SPD-2-Hydin